MNEPDSKKLIAGFLVLATIMSSGAFALSGYLTTKANKNEVKRGSSIINAFSKNKPKDLNILAGQDSANLTRNLAEDIAKGILSSNQDGPQSRSGLPSIELPSNIESILDKYVGELELTENIFDIDKTRIKINKNPSAKDFETYFKSLADILKPSIEGDETKNLKNKLKSSPDESTINAMSLLYSETQIKIYALEVPDKALAFHESLIKSLNVPVVVIGKNLNDDPIKSFALLRASEDLFDSYSAELIKEYNLLKIELKDLSLDSNEDFVFIKTANAAGVPVIDFVNWIESIMINIAEWMRIPWEQKSFLDKLMITLIKERLLNQIVNGILNWAQGDIVGNWQEYLLKTFEVAADSYIQKAAQGFCTTYRNQLVDQLQKDVGAKSPSFGGVAARSGMNVGCPLETMVSDIDMFYKDFSLGGWGAYDAMTLPSSNFYTNLFDTSQRATAVAQDAKRTREMELLAGGGAAPTERCEDGSSPKNGACPKGKPEVTTPGATKTDLIGKGLSSAIDRIVNANAEEWEDLAVALANSAINKLLTSGNKGIKKGNITDSKPGDPYAACSGYSSGSDEQLACIDNVNRSRNPSGSGSSRAALIKQANSLLEEASSTLDTIFLSIETVSSTITILEEVKLSCPAQSEAAERELITANQDLSNLSMKADEVLSQKSAIEIFIEEILAHDEDDSDFFRGKYAELNSIVDMAELGRTKAEASGNLANFQTKLQEATTLLQQCTAP